MPPETKAPPPQAISSERVEEQILHQLRAEPTLSDTNLDARVDDNAVVLTGNVHTMAQHDLALVIAQANAGDRKIVDKVKIKLQA
jgi:osmotically-inducible protein OsmY